MELPRSGLYSADGRIGKYELRNVIARTALSIVYDGWDAAIERRVAIKMMQLSLIDDDNGREALARFRRGARAAGRLSHPNIVAVYDYGESDHYAYIVMEFIDGPTLKMLLEGNQRLPIAEVATLMSGLLDALQYSHDRRIVHRDIKPANVMFTKENAVKITDFGIARIDNSDLTQTGMVIGTPAYMAPEQFLSEAVDQRTDIYATGVLLYHILTGERPYGGTVATIMHKVLNGVPLPPSKLSTAVTPALDLVVAKAMARDPQNRFQSAAAFKAELTKALNTPKVSRASPSNSTAVIREKIRISVSGPPRRGLAIATLLLATTVAGGAIVWHRLGKHPASGAADHVAQLSESQRLAPSATGTQNLPSSESTEGERSGATTPSTADNASSLDRGDAGDLNRGPHNDAIAVSPPASPEGAHAEMPGTSAANPDATDPSILKFSNKRPAAGVTANLPARNAKPTAPSDSDQHVKPPDSTPRADEDPVGDTMRRLRAGLPGRDEEPGDGNYAANSYPVTSLSPALGLLCQSVTPTSAAQLGLRSAHGMLVLGVTSGSAAELAGISQNDVIAKVNGKDISNLSELRKIAATMSPGQFASVDILRNREHHLINLPVDKLRN